LRKSINQDCYQLIDARTSDERRRFHIGGTHIPLPDLKSKLRQLKTDKPIVFYCETGKRSSEAVKEVKEHVMSKVQSLEGDSKHG
jgi:adenylyltransferase/sulfurtransferase